jgi:hypothetical protein
MDKGEGIMPGVFAADLCLPPYTGPMLTPLQYEVLCRHVMARECGIPLGAIRSGFVNAPATAGAAPRRLRHQIDLYWTSSDGVCEFLVFANAKFQRSDVSLPALMTLIGVQHDIHAQKAMLITNSGFSPSVQAQAREKGIALLIVRPVDDFDADRLFEFPTHAVAGQLELLASERSSPLYQIHTIHKAFSLSADPATSPPPEDPALNGASPWVPFAPGTEPQNVRPVSIPNKAMNSPTPAMPRPSSFGIRRK